MVDDWPPGLGDAHWRAPLLSLASSARVPTPPCLLCRPGYQVDDYINLYLRPPARNAVRPEAASRSQHLRHRTFTWAKAAHTNSQGMTGTSKPNWLTEAPLLLLLLLLLLHPPPSSLERAASASEDAPSTPTQHISRTSSSSDLKVTHPKSAPAGSH